MHQRLISFLLAESVLFPFLAAAWRWPRANPAYRPFFLLMAAGVLSELASFLQIYYRIIPIRSNAGVANVYSILECLLVFWLFFRWRNGRMTTRTFGLMMGTAVAVWIFCNFVLFHLNDYDFPLFRILYPFTIVILSVNEINKMITHDSGQLYKNARFLICMGFIVFFLYQILYEGAYMSVNARPGKMEGVSNKVISLFSYVNVFTNMVFTVAILLVPNRHSSAFEQIFEKIGDEA